MKIKSIEVENFKSIGKISLDVKDFNILIGQNNHGKTNFLEAISWFFNGGNLNGSIVRKGERVESVKVEIVFDGAQEALGKMKHEKNRETIRKRIIDQDVVRIVRKIIEGKPQRLIWSEEKNDYVDPGTGFDKALNDFLANFEFVKTESNLKDVLKYGRNTQIGNMLSGVLNEILASGDEQYSKFLQEFNDLFGSGESRISQELSNIAEKVKGYLGKQFPECSMVDFQVKNPDLTDLFKNFTANIDDGVNTEAHEKGDGMQRALMLAIIQTYADYRREKKDIKNFIFLIDEGELHLHPTAQRKLKNALVELATGGDQVFITTHSSVLIADEEEDMQSGILKVYKQEGVTDISFQQNEEKQDIVFDLLGGSPADLLLPRNFIIVEGDAECEFLKTIINRFHEEAKGIKILPAFGFIDNASRLAVSLEKIFTPLDKSIYGKKFAVLLDMFNAEKMSEAAFGSVVDKMTNFSKDEQLKMLPVGSIEEYYPIAREDQIVEQNSHEYVEKWRRTPLEVSRMNGKSKKKLAKIVAQKIDYEQLKSEMPRIEEVILLAIKNSFE